MNFNRSNTVVCFYVLCALFISACGGDDSSETSFESELTSPLAEAIDDNGQLVEGDDGQLPMDDSDLPDIDLGARQFTDANVLLELEASVEPADGASIARSLWTSVSATQIDLPAGVSNKLLIITPDVAVTRVLEFRFTAQDTEGRVNSDTLPVVVRPLDSPLKVIGNAFNETDQVASFTIRLTEPAEVDMNVTYATQNGSAVAGEDFVLTSGSLQIAAGERTATVDVPLINDAQQEDDESFSLQALATDGTNNFANIGPAIIRDGLETTILLPQSIAFSNPGPINLEVGENITNPFDEGSAPQGDGALLYSSSAPEVATVDANGSVTAVAVGSSVITAIQEAGTLYDAGEASYSVSVTDLGIPPQIDIVDSDGIPISVFSFPGRRSPPIGVAINDEEDGQLPSAEQLAVFDSTGVPLEAYQWQSNIDGELGFGHIFPDVELTVGAHRISFSATDSDGNTATETIDLLVGNIATEATASSPDTNCLPSESDSPICFEPVNVNDGDLNKEPQPQFSWMNNVDGLPATLDLTWVDTFVRAQGIEIHSSNGAIIRDFSIEYRSTDEIWTGLLSVTGNTSLVRRFDADGIVINGLRIVATSGPDSDPNFARINEVVVFGSAVETNEQNIAFVNPGPVALALDDVFTNSFVEGQAPQGTGELTYTSSNTAIALVNVDGQVTAVGEGIATITANKAADNEFLSGSASYDVVVEVEPQPQNMAFAMTNSEALTVGDTFTNSFAEGQSPQGAGALTYSSSNSQVATVDANGDVTAVAAGIATITANKAADNEFLSGSASYDVVVEVEPQPQNMAFAMTNPEALTVGDTFTNSFAEGQSPQGAGALTYSSSNSQVATVDANGEVTAVAAGAATITANKAADNEFLSGSASYDVVVEVEPQPQNMAFAMTNPEALTVGDTFTNSFAEGQSPQGAGALTYSSSNSQVATVAANGQVTAVSEGPATITATKAADNNFLSGSASYAIRVLPRDEAPQIVFVNANGAPIVSSSISGNRNPDITPSITDAEDGNLPTAEELAVFAATGVPLQNYSWESDIQGSLGNGHIFPDVTLQQGRHLIRFTAQDSFGNSTTETIDVLVGNIAPLAFPLSRRSNCPDQQDFENCFESFRINDTNISTEQGGLFSWMNDEQGLPADVGLQWNSGLAFINRIDVFSSEGAVVQDFDIQYRPNANSDWLDLVTVTDNDAVIREFLLDFVVTVEIRVVVNRGSKDEPEFGRINEIAVYGVFERGQVGSD